MLGDLKDLNHLEEAVGRLNESDKEKHLGLKAEFVELI